MSWPDIIRDGLDEDRFVLQAQPIMDLATGDIRQFELLLRLRDPFGELISPAAFLPAAERYDLIGAIDRWVVSRSIAMLAEENRRGRRLTFEVNISGRSTGDPELLALIEGELRSPRGRPGAGDLRDHRDDRGREHPARAGVRRTASPRSAAASRSTTSAPPSRRSTTSSTCRSTT